MEFEFVTDPIFLAGLALGVVIVFGAFAVRYPLLLALAKKKIAEAEAFVLANEASVPPEFKGIVDDAKECLKDLKFALEDDRISYQEVYMLALDFLAIADEVKDVIMHK